MPYIPQFVFKYDLLTSADIDKGTSDLIPERLFLIAFKFLETIVDLIYGLIAESPE